jgi:dipeptidyl aminopeptidase/acylaminoacyl peptidase
MRRATSIATAAVLLALAAPFGLAWYASEQILRSPPYEHRTPAQGLRPGVSKDPQHDHGLPYEDVAFAAIDGSTLRGWFVPAREPPRGAVVTVHGGGGDRRSYMGLLPVLHDAGYSVLMFDCREQGISDGAGRGISLGMRESADVVSAVDWLSERGFETIAALGSSQGATSVILAAGVDSRIDAVVAQGTGTTLYAMSRANGQLALFPDWFVRLFVGTILWRTGPPWHEIVADGPNPANAIGHIAPRPILLIQGADDAMAPATQARKNFELAGEPKQLWIVAGAGHRGLRQTAGDDYDRRILAFLSEHLENTP